jgi:hypothetical protein
MEDVMADAERNTATDQGREEGAKPDSAGPNARPRNDTISQTGPGLPDDSSTPVEVDPDTEKRIERDIRSL